MFFVLQALLCSVYVIISVEDTKSPNTWTKEGFIYLTVCTSLRGGEGIGKGGTKQEQSEVRLHETIP